MAAPERERARAREAILEEGEDEVEAFKMSLSEHLEELRQRLIYALIAVGALAVLAYAFKEPLLALLTEPLQEAFPFAEDFSVRLKEWLRAARAQDYLNDREIEWLVRSTATSAATF